MVLAYFLRFTNYNKITIEDSDKVMGSCTTKGKNADVVDKAHSILSKEGYLVKEVRDGKLGERPIPNKVAIVLKD